MLKFVTDRKNKCKGQFTHKFLKLYRVLTIVSAFAVNRDQDQSAQNVLSDF